MLLAAQTSGFFPDRVLIMTSLMHWFAVNASVLAVLVTVGVAVLLVCCLECSDCSCRDKDEIFHHHEV
jgi:hypothetical protein